jgi:hypothetical protein
MVKTISDLTAYFVDRAIEDGLINKTKLECDEDDEQPKIL